MGADQSSFISPSKDVFSKELTKVNNIVNKVVTFDGKFVNPNYNFLFEDVCRNYTILWQNELGKHLKVDLENLSGSIYLIPKKDLIVSPEHQLEVSKQELCKQISKHYVKILYILTLIKTVFDLEHHGDNSVAGVMRRNIKIVDNIMEISYCSIPQRDYDVHATGRIDFESLKGFKLFVDNFLTPVEKYAFLEQFKAVLERKPQHKIVQAVCTDVLIPLHLYERIYSTKLNKKLVCEPSVASTSRSKRKASVDLLFDVAENNPILHTSFCLSPKKLVISLDRPDPEIKTIIALKDKMYDNYVENINNISDLLTRIVESKNGGYELRNVSNHELHILVKDVKQIVIAFYLQSLVDFHLLLDSAKQIPSLRLDKNK